MRFFSKRHKNDTPDISVTTLVIPTTNVPGEAVAELARAEQKEVMYLFWDIGTEKDEKKAEKNEQKAQSFFAEFKKDKNLAYICLFKNKQIGRMLIRTSFVINNWSNDNTRLFDLFQQMEAKAQMQGMSFRYEEL